MQNLAFLYRSFNDCACQNEIFLNIILIRYQKLWMKILIISELAGRSEKIEKLISKSKFWPETLEMKKMGITS